MILSEYIIITITNQGKYWSSLGYTIGKHGTKLKVKVSDLPKNSNKKVICSCDLCSETFERQFQLLNRSINHFCRTCARKEIAKNLDNSKLIELNRSRTGSKHPRWNPEKKEFQTYAYKVRQKTEKTYRTNIDVLNPNRLPRTVCGIKEGYQLDHKISIKEGFDKNIEPDILASIENLELIPWEENRGKSSS